jgi:hypothetical protein
VLTELVERERAIREHEIKDIEREEDRARLFAVRSRLAMAMQVARAGTYETRDIIEKLRSRLRLHFEQGLIEKKRQRMGTTMGHLMVSDRIEEK